MPNHVDLIVRFEGFHSRAYWDYAQWSVGYGSYAGSRNRNSRPPIDNISEAEGRRLLAQEVSRFERHVDGYNSRYNWTPNERAALISFAYNIGSIDQLTDNGRRSKAEISQAMLLYNKAGGETLPGLVRRRQTERDIFTGGAPLPPATDLANVGIAPTPGVEGAGATGVADGTNDFAAAGNMADLWSIAEQSGNFWDNELDKYDMYTYTLELFIVDQATAISFLDESYSLDDIVTNSWPQSGTKRVTIGMTGATTEFNIQDLNVDSRGFSSGNNAQMSNVSTHLSFNIVQVGNTSLNDSLQNAAILSGYTSIHDATWFMKINFIGHVNNQPETLNATKILPFKISNFKDLQTTTDARGTATILEGTILQRSAFDITNNIIEHTFTFDIKDTLRETIESFLDKLNQVISDNDFSVEGTTDNNGNVTGSNLSSPYINTYEFRTTTEFEEAFMSSPMNGPQANLSSASNEVARRQNGLNISQQVAQVPTGQNIYDILQDICIQSTNIADVLRESSNTFTDTFVIIPTIVPKENGLNVITNTRGYKIIYNFSIRRTPIIQNQANMYSMVQNTATMVDEIFTKGRCRKRYYYQYTGLNDQILDLTVSLNKQLQKAYVAPSDNFVWANFVNTNGTSLDSILATNQRALGAINEARDLVGTLTTDVNAAAENLRSIRDDAADIVGELRNSFISDLRSQGLGSGEAEAAAASLISNNSTITDAIQAINRHGSEENGIVSPERQTRINELMDRAEAAQETISTSETRLREAQRDQDRIMQQAIGGIVSQQTQEAVNAQSNELFSSNDTNNDGLILIEELDTDFVTRLSTEEFNGLIDTMMDNPMVFRRVIVSRLLESQSPGIWRTSAREEIELARQKYYEGLDVDISMQNLTMTIKGDPFWFSNYIPSIKISDIFADSATVDQYRNETTDSSGQNYCMIITNKAAGTDDLDNIKIANLMIAVYQVKSIKSSFSGGTFTQTLDMIKMPFPADFRAVNPTIDAQFESLDAFGGDGNSLGNSGVGGDTGIGIGDRPGFNTIGSEGTGISGGEELGITAPIGGGSALLSTDGPGGTTETNIVVQNPEAAYASANVALLNAVSSAFNTDNGFPSAAGAVQLAYALNQMRGLCENGVRAACSSVSLAEQEIIRGYQIGDSSAEDYVRDLNEAITEDPEFSITPEGIAILNQALINQNMDPLNVDAIINLDSSQVDSFNEAIELDMQRYYVGTDDIISDNTAPMISLDPSQPGGAFAQNNAEILLNSTDPFDPRESSFNSYASATGMPDRSISTQIPPNTLTPIEMERAVVIQKELEAMIRETPLTSMTDTEYARARQLEQALEGIVENATTGTRGEIRDEVIQREKRSELANVKEQLTQVESNLDGWYWTTAGREEDEIRREEIRKQVLIAQTENRPIVMDEVQRVVNPETGEPELRPVYTPTSISDRPIIIPKPDPLPDVYIDNEDGTITVEGPTVQRPTVTSEGAEAIDATSLSDDQKQEFLEALGSNNGIKVQQFIDSLPDEQQNEIYQLEQTQNLVQLPGSVVDTSLPGLANVPEESARQFTAAQAVYDNITNQFVNLPFVQKSFTYPDGKVDTWEERDLTQLQPVRYVDSNGNVQTFNPLETGLLDDGMGWTPRNQEKVLSGIAENFDAVTFTRGGTGPQSGDGRTRVSIGFGNFAIVDLNNEEGQE